MLVRSSTDAATTGAEELGSNGASGGGTRLEIYTCGRDDKHSGAPSYTPKGPNDTVCSAGAKLFAEQALLDPISSGTFLTGLHLWDIPAEPRPEQRIEAVGAAKWAFGMPRPAKKKVAA